MAADKAISTFISYSRVNQQFAIRLTCALKSAGFRVWMDQFDIPTGARWDDEIEKALRECQIFLFILTPASTASENAKDEMGYAIDHGKHILPVLLENCEVPLRLRRVQYVDFTRMSFDEGINKAKELLSRLVMEIDGTAQETSTSNGKIAFSVNEPKTIPTGARPTLTNVQIKRRERTKLSTRVVAVEVGILCVGVLVIAGLILRPFLFPVAPLSSPTSNPVPTRTLVATDTRLPTNIPDTPTAGILRSFVEDFNSDI